MTLFRLTTARYAEAPFAGTGGLHADGRWHPRGIRVAYAAANPSLALVELLVQAPIAALRARAAANGGLVLAEIDVPSADILDLAGFAPLPDGWDVLPPPYARATQAIGARFVAEAPALALRVPSAVVPREHNALVGPLHDRASAALATLRITPFDLDTRFG